MPKFIDRTGETVIAKNGMKMVIIAYRGSMDVDVQFEDGTIVEHLNYSNIVKGVVKNPNLLKRLRIGESKRARNGQVMTIIDYRSADDLDIMFDDGAVVPHATYRRFSEGTIGNPNTENSRNTRTHRLGKSGVNQNGMKITIIAYRSATDIDVLFEDGYVAEHTHYCNFANKNVPYPGFSLRTHNVKNAHLGEKNVANNGMEMTIIAYRHYSDIDVQFTDGAVVTTAYKEFSLGKVGNPNIHKSAADFKAERVNAVTVNNQGISMQIIKYINSKNSVVRFETGCEIRISNYARFCVGRTQHPVPYQVGIISMDKLAYTFGDQGNFYCHCTKCGHTDIMTIPEMKLHICNI